MQSYSQDLRDRVLGALGRGEGPSAIARRFEVSRFYVYQVRDREQETGVRSSFQIGGHRRSRLQAAEAALRGWMLALPYGDQGLLIPKRLYHKLGGYRALAVMEDADLVRRIGRRRLVHLRARAINLPRPQQSVWRGLWLSLLHALRIPSGVVARL